MDEQNETILLEMPASAEIVNVTEICRLCAKKHEKLIGIYSEEGETNDLESKMNSYLPIKVDKNDNLPLQCCWQCASTLLNWHELVISTIEANRRFQSYQFQIEKLENETETDLPKVEGNEGCNIEILNQNQSVLVERADINDYTSNYGEYIALQQEYLPLQAIYDTPNTPEMDTNVTLSSDSVMEKNKLEIDDNDEITKNDNEEECYGCHVCQMVFFSEEKMHDHISENHPVQKVENDVLGNQRTEKKGRKKNTKLNQDMVNAAKIIIDNKVYYNCKECGRCLHSPYTYVWHLRIHTGERPHICHRCGKCFRVSQGLVRHLKETHEGIKTFPCDLCGRMFGTRRNVEEHRRIHTNERPYSCELCGKSFKQKASLYVHNRSHLDVFPFKCSYCHQVFRTKPPMLIHITKHTGERPYACDICGRRFRIKYELKRHRLIHFDEKPFACDLCGLRFKQKRYLKNHNKLNHPDN